MNPYAMMSCAEVREILGRRAPGEQELLEAIEDVPADSIYYHTHSYYLRGKYAHDRYPNDFATWAAEHVRDRVLGERLAVVDPFALSDLEALRAQLAGLIESHLDELGFSPRALFGEPFEFVVAHVVPVPTGLDVRTRAGLRDALRAATHDTLYWHFFEDAFRRGRRTGSLVRWVADELRDEPLASALGALNPYRMHLESFRASLLRAFGEEA
jgi:hypothetical protein